MSIRQERSTNGDDGPNLATPDTVSGMGLDYEMPNVCCGSGNMFTPV